MKAADYSFSRPDLATLKALGYVGILRYLAPLPNSKVLTGSERDEILSHGLAIGLVWETTATRAAAGYEAGKSDALYANHGKGMADDLGVPATATIYYAVDFDANPNDVLDYFQGANDALGRPVGVYGSCRVCEAVLAAGLATKAWQTTAWSRGQRCDRAHLFQNVGAPIPGIDDNDILAADWGQFPRPTEPAPPAPTEEPDMLVLQHNGDYLLHSGKIVPLNVALPPSIPRCPCDDRQWAFFVAAFGQPVQ